MTGRNKERRVVWDFVVIRRAGPENGSYNQFEFSNRIIGEEIKLHYHLD
jgi:hypothetical protein